MIWKEWNQRNCLKWKFVKDELKNPLNEIRNIYKKNNFLIKRGVFKIIIRFRQNLKNELFIKKMYSLKYSRF